MEQRFSIEQVVTIAMLALLTFGAVLVLVPFLPALLWAMVFAISTWPLFDRLERALNGRSGLAAGLLTLVFALVFMIPVGLVGGQLADEVPRLLDALRDVREDGMPPAPDWLRGLPFVGTWLADLWTRYSSDFAAVVRAVTPYLRDIADWILAAGAGLGRALLQIVLSLFILFFLYRDGRPVAQRLERLVGRLGGDRGRRLLAVAGDATRAVVYGVLGAALAQGVLSLIGLGLAGVPGWLFLGMVATLLALIPIGLHMLVLLPAAGWLLATGSPGAGFFLLAWTILVVGNVDNVIRPIIISRGARLPFPIVLLGVLGGLITMGLVGLFVGATILAVFYTLLKEWSAQTLTPGASADAVPPPDDVENPDPMVG